MIDINENLIVGNIQAEIRPQNDIKIYDVGIHPSYRGRKLCSYMMIEFINSTNDDGNYTYTLLQAGGVKGLKCYLGAFRSMNYTCENINSDDALKHGTCDENSYYIKFSKSTS